MLDMAFLSIIRRWHKRDHVPIREISRRTGVSRNTIRKYLRSDVIEPKFRVPDRPSKLDPYAEKLSAWLRREAGRPRKQRRTAKQLYGDLVSLATTVPTAVWRRLPGSGRSEQASRRHHCATTGNGCGEGYQLSVHR